ncbi:MAG: ABC transporter permease [Chloroflexi bacterium]|nr:ABC transporter permease [Chloroflexota bacterium]
MSATEAGARTTGSGGPLWSGSASPNRSRAGGLADSWRAFRTAARLGLEIEANWADPLPFIVYTVIKPVFSALILVFMIEIISGGRVDPAYRAFVVIGSALWSFVVGGIAGFAQSVLEDRERYRMLKYLYVSPNDLLTLLLGRGIWRLAIGGLGALVTLALGVFVLGIPFRVETIDWLLLALSMALGLLAIIALGMILASISMQTRQDAWQYPEAVAGALFLVVGAVFPLSVLPGVVQIGGLLTPLTWWLEGVRRALFSETVSAIGGPGSTFTALTGTAAPSTPEILVALSVTTAVVTLAAVAVYRWSERRAKERGLFDQTTAS